MYSLLTIALVLFGCSSSDQASLSDKSISGLISTVIPPSAPSGLVATASSNAISLSWSQVTGATAYTVYRSTTSGSGYAELSGCKAQTPLTCSDLTFVSGTVYYYVVQASNDAGNSANSNEASAFVDAGPTAPTLTLGAVGNASVDLSWTAPTGFGTLTYNIYRGTSAGAESVTAIASGISGTTWTDNSGTGNPSNGTSYFYKVKAVATGGTSPYSNEVSGTPYAAPSAPTLSLGTVGNASVGLSWSAPAGFGALTYSILRGTSASGESGTAIATGISGTTWTTVILQRPLSSMDRAALRVSCNHLPMQTGLLRDGITLAVRTSMEVFGLHRTRAVLQMLPIFALTRIILIQRW